MRFDKTWCTWGYQVAQGIFDKDLNTWGYQGVQGILIKRFDKGNKTI